MVINGPVANAGSILYLFSISGINVPKIPAKKITEISAMLTVMAKVNVSSKNNYSQK